MHDIRTFGKAEDRVVEQLTNCLDVEPGSIGVLCADNHIGYSQPIGAAVAYRNHISPSGVGYDIGCGNKAVKTSLLYQDIREDLSKIADEITRRVSFGMGQSAAEETKDHPVFDSIANSEFEPQQKLLGKARAQLGTVGAGNHYVDLFKDETDRVWIGVHFGSRGLGHKTASGFLALAEGKAFDEHASEGEMFSPPVVFHTDSALGYAYIAAMKVAGEYAYAGRDIVCDKVLDILGAESMEEIHNHHNFAWREKHDGEEFWVVRKGCTPAFPNQQGFVGATMGETSVILEGVLSEASRESLFSTVHGAGRQLSRSKAKGKIRRRKRWECGDRDCDYSEPSSGNKTYGKGFCPNHPNAKPRKIWVEEVKSPGLINFDEVQADLRARGIILKGGAADEAPGAYKRLDEVLEAHTDMIQVDHRLEPLVVVMAGPNVKDPYKD